MKQIQHLVMAVFMALGLAACQNDLDFLGASYEKKESVLPPTTVGFVIARNDDNSPYLQKVHQVATELGKSTPNLSLLLADAKGSVDAQYAEMDKMIAQGAKALVVNLVDGSKGGELLSKYCGKVPLVFYVISPGDKPLAKCDSAYFVNSDPAQGSVALGLSVLQNWQSNPAWDKNGDGKIQIALMDAFPAQIHTKSRGDWAISTIESYPAIHKKAEVLFGGAGRFRTDVAEEVATAWILDPNFTNVEVIVSSADSMSYGILDAMQKHHVSPPPMFSVNRLTPTQEIIKQGKMIDSVATDFDSEVRAALRLAMNLANNAPATQGINYHIHDKQLLVPFIVSPNAKQSS